MDKNAYRYVKCPFKARRHRLVLFIFTILSKFASLFWGRTRFFKQNTRVTGLLKKQNKQNFHGVQKNAYNDILGV